MRVLIPGDLSSNQGAIFRKCAKERTCEYAVRRESLSQRTKVSCRAVWWASNISITKRVYYVKGKVYLRTFECSRLPSSRTGDGIGMTAALVRLSSENSPTLWVQDAQGWEYPAIMD